MVLKSSRKTFKWIFSISFDEGFNQIRRWNILGPHFWSVWWGTFEFSESIWFSIFSSVNLLNTFLAVGPKWRDFLCGMGYSPFSLKEWFCERESQVYVFFLSSPIVFIIFPHRLSILSTTQGCSKSLIVTTADILHAASWSSFSLLYSRFTPKRATTACRKILWLNSSIHWMEITTISFRESIILFLLYLDNSVV